MREFSSETLTKSVALLFEKANYFLPAEVKEILKEAQSKETSNLGKYIFSQMEENIQIAEERRLPLCQDTGMAVVFLDIGQEVKIKGEVEESINKGIALATKNGCLRESIVKPPLFARKNTEDNTPAVIHYNFVPGDKVKLTVMPKGFGAENMSQLKMLKPAEGLEGVKNFVLQVVKEGGKNACPPLFLGIGVGGGMEKAALLAKQALLRPFTQSNPEPEIAKLEDELLREVNELGIGPQGVGGKVTALGVNIATFPTHIAGLPVAVNLSCYLLRYKSVVI